MLSYTNSKRNNVKITNFAAKKRNTVGILTKVAVVFILSAVFVQLYVMSTFATKGKEVSNLEVKKAQLIKSNKELNESIARSRNVENLEAQSKELGFVESKPNEIRYIELTAGN